MTDDEAVLIGQAVHDALDGNLLVGSFAAELAGESYPFSKAAAAIVFEAFTNRELGYRFAEWCEASA